MRFTWNEAKRRSNLAKHGIDIAAAERVFAGPTFTFLDERFISVGLLGEIVVVVAHTESDDEVRVISMRKADRHEQTIFFENL